MGHKGHVLFHFSQILIHGAPFQLAFVPLFVCENSPTHILNASYASIMHTIFLPFFVLVLFWI